MFFDDNFANAARSEKVFDEASLYIIKLFNSLAKANKLWSQGKSFNFEKSDFSYYRSRYRLSLCNIKIPSLT